MSQLYAALVSETVLQAVRLALDDYAAVTSHNTSVEASALSGAITPAEEAVIRCAVLTSLQNLREAQISLSGGSMIRGGEAETEVLRAAHAGATTASLRKSLSQLIDNSTALDNVVQQIVTRLRAHLGDRRAPSTRNAGAVTPGDGAAREVTQVLKAAIAEQQGNLFMGTDANKEARAVSDAAFSTSPQWVWMVATLLLGCLMVRFVFGRVLGFGGALGRRHRTRTVLIGLPDSGKTALFGQLVRHMQLRETQTSMRENVGPLLVARERGMAETAPGVSVVDCPGHPRLREHMLRAVGEAVNVVVVIDAVTVQDSQQEGVAALAELLLGVLQSPEFYGVRRLLFACTKRDEVTSYTAKAVRKLLETAMVASIESRQNGMGRVESVRDSSNTVITGRSRKSGGSSGGGGRRYVLSVDGGESVGLAGSPDATRDYLRGADGAGAGVKRFSFEQLGIPFAFVDVSSRPHPTDHKYSVTPVEEFILE